MAGDYEHGYRVHGDRWYRMLNLHAGILAQRIGLAATGLGLGSMQRCDYEPKIADRLIHAAPGRTVLLVVLVGLEHGVGKPGHRLLLGGYGSWPVMATCSRRRRRCRCRQMEMGEDR